MGGGWGVGFDNVTQVQASLITALKICALRRGLGSRALVYSLVYKLGLIQWDNLVGCIASPLLL